MPLSVIPLQFNYIPYPLWRRKLPGWIRPLAHALYRRIYPVSLDLNPPQTPDTIADYLQDFGLMAHVTVDDVLDVSFRYDPIDTSMPARKPRLPMRIPAQWEPIDAVLLNFPVIYPPLWPLYAEMVEAASVVAEVQLLVPNEWWARGAALYLTQRGKADMTKVKFLSLPVDDIWMRDYGPVVGYDATGARSVFDLTYATHPQYPQTRDDHMPLSYAAYLNTAGLHVPLKTEGGNLLTDGRGTLIMTEKILQMNPQFTRETLEDFLHRYFDYEKLILTPRLKRETTGHVDLMVKLASENTVFISKPTTPTTRAELEATHTIFRHETNAKGDLYQIVPLPTLPLYYNWFFYPIRRSYTNSLTVNGRMLVPVYGCREDEIALQIYADTMPEYEIIPIDCKVGVNGGGAVHCLTKEVPSAR